MNLVQDLSLFSTPNGVVNMVVETPKGSGIKLKYNESAKVFEWSRPLIAGLTFPHDFGFLPQTLADDGDALDAVALTDVRSYPGVVIPSRIIGALRVEQQRDGEPPRRNDRLIVIPCNDHRQAEVTDITSVPNRLRAELESFCTASLSLTGKKVQLKGWADGQEAIALATAAAERYVENL